MRKGEPGSKTLIALIVILFAAVVFLQNDIHPIKARIDKASNPRGGAKTGELMLQLPAQFVVASVTGFKEVIAGALWVRADSFFHMGEYQAIMPIVRMVTWLDPHNLDVYTTGAWHLDYNFVDQDQRSDKRYIPASIALLKEGIANNPNIWDLYFELGWTHYNKKLMDYKNGLKYIEKACTLEGFDINTGKKVRRPEFADRMLAHQYEQLGRFDDAIRMWGQSRRRVEEMVRDERKETTFVDRSSLDVCDRNLSLLYLRMAWRYGNMEAYRKGLDICRELTSREAANMNLKRATAGIEKDYAWRVANHKPPADVSKPLDAGLEVTVKKAASKILLIKGKVNLIRASEYKDLASEAFTFWYGDNQKKNANERELWRDGSRVNWMLADYDYKMPDLKTFDWKVDMNQTVAWDSIYIGGGTFSDRIDFSQDPGFYPFKAKKYRLTIWVSPQQGASALGGCPDYIQDRIGWKGEALRDKKYLDTKTQPGFRMLRKEFILDRKDII